MRLPQKFLFPILRTQNRLSANISFSPVVSVYLMAFLLMFAASSSVRAQTNQAPQDTVEISLKEALNRGMKENADIRSAKLDIEKSQKRIDEVRGNFLPQIDINGNYTRNLKLPAFFLPEGGGGFPGGGGGDGNVIRIGNKNSYQIGAQATLPLYNPKLIQNNQLAKSASNVSHKQLDVNQNQARQQIKNAYFNALLAQSSLDVTAQSLENARSNYENIKNQNEQGLAPDYDVLRAKVQVENTKPEVKDAHKNYLSALNRLKLLIGMNIQQPITLEGDLKAYYEAFPKEKLKNYSLEKNPKVQQLQLQKDLQRNQISVEESAYYPSLSASAGYNYQAQQNNFKFQDYSWVNTATAGLQVQIPIFSGFSRKNRVDQAKVELEKIEVQEQNLERSLKVQVENALEEINQVEERVKAQKENIRQAKKGFQIAQKSYENGAVNIVELNDAELALSRAKMNYSSAIHDYLTALVNYEQIVNQNLITE